MKKGRLAYATQEVSPMSPQDSHALPWWKKTVIYQIYPRSFKDSTNNGIGDIPGIISKLDYLKELGIETIWFSPFFASPQVDHGYDVSDYRSIAPEYGTMSDCERLIQEIHTHEMYVIFDMVLNHTSDQHAWFLESRSSRENPKREWYIWRDGKKLGGKKPPNNWTSMIGGSGWHYDALTDQWYWAQFLPFQPDLNHRNPAVKKEMFDTVRFWLDKGVDGFRLDIIDTVYEDEHLRDNPFTFQYFPSEEGRKRFFHDCIHTIHHPDNFQFVKELRKVLDEYSEPERFLVGEVGASLATHKRYSGEVVNGTRTDGLHMTFQFQSLNADLNALAFRHLMSEYESHFEDPYIPTWVFSNHDVTRRISKLGNDVAKAKLNALIQLTARGVPFIYMGEEIGMLYHKIPLQEAEDPVAQKFSRLPRFLTDFVSRDGKICLNRDGCRTPIQWDSSDNGGFSKGGVETWLPLEPHYRAINVELQEKDPASILNCYRQLLGIRRNHPALHSGSIQFKELEKEYKKSLLTYERLFYSPDFQQIVQIILNFTNDSYQVRGFEGKKTLLFSTISDSTPIGDSTINLQPLEGIIIKIQ